MENNENFIKRGIKTVLFVLAIISTLAQTALTFFLLYRKSTDERLSQIIFILWLAYLIAFLVIVIMSLGSRKISPEAMTGYKRSRKAVKRILTLLMLVLSMVNLINSKTGGVELVLSIAMIAFNFFVIYIDMKISQLTDKLARRKKKRERAKKEAEIRAYRVGDKKRGQKENET